MLQGRFVESSCLELDRYTTSFQARAILEELIHFTKTADGVDRYKPVPSFFVCVHSKRNTLRHLSTLYLFARVSQKEIQKSSSLYYYFFIA